MLNLDWKPETNPNTGKSQLVARVTGKLESIGSKLLESKVEGNKPYYLNTITVVDKEGTVAEDVTAMFYPGEKNKLEDCIVGKTYLTKVIWTPGAENLLYCNTALIAGNRTKAGSDAEFDALFAKLTAGINMEL
jgi:hypothetical protein